MLATEVATRSRQDARLADLTTALVAQSRLMSECREPQRIQKAAALREANVEQVAGAALDGAASVHKTAKRLIQHQRYANAASQ